MKELLEKWATLETNRCKADSGWPWVLLPSGWCSAWNADSPNDRAIIQAAVQEAIEARGWYWQTAYYPRVWEGRRHKARVDRYDGGTIEEADAPTTSEALLWAYLNALEAQG